MKGFLLLLLVYALFVAISQATTPLKKMFRDRPSLRPAGAMEDSEALFLTPLIKAGKSSEARKRAQVSGLFQNVKSYSGFITVNEDFNSNMFFWFFPARGLDDQMKGIPVILWLQGGPGGSSLYGLFNEHGPVFIKEDLSVGLRKYAWSSSFHILYVDNPVGTGFSFTDSEAGYAKNEDKVAEDLYEFLVQFFHLFPDLRHDEFYVTGESYAGKYVPAIAHKIHVENQRNTTFAKNNHIGLTGIAIGDGLCDPISMLDYACFLFEHGFLDVRGKDYMKAVQNKVHQLINNNRSSDYILGFKIWDELLNGDETGYPSYFYNATGFHNYFNYLKPEPDKDDGFYEKYVNQEKVRDAIHVGNLPYHNGTIVERHLIEDMLKSVKPQVIDLLNSDFKVLFYSGQLDIIVAYPLTMNFLNTLDDWKGIKDYRKAKRSVWKVGKEIAGYAKTSGNLQEVLVRKAGHMVPKDQPKWAWDLIHRFIHGKPF